MKTYDLHDEAGRVLAFEVDNFWLGRKGTAAIVQSIPDATVIRKPGAIATSGEEGFLLFQIGARRFVAWEPWGDSSRYWIGPDPPGYSEDTEMVRAAFQNIPRAWFAALPASTTAWILGLIAMVFSGDSPLSDTIRAAGALISIGGFLARVLLIRRYGSFRRRPG